MTWYLKVQVKLNSDMVFESTS